jgi:NADH:ubiquinone oxidoreductase subunit 6 (subunit J)
MSAEIIMLSVLAGIAVLFSLGVLISKDNFYASLSMTLTLIFVASVYALFDIQSVFVLIVFIFVGAIGIITVALAATYRSAPERQFSGAWAVPVAIIAFLMGVSIFWYNMLRAPPAAGNMIDFILANFVPFVEPFTEYFFIIISMISLSILLLLAVLKIGIGGTED